MNVQPEEAILVAAHGWDIAGAKGAGLQAVFVARPCKTLYPLAAKPDAPVPLERAWPVILLAAHSL